MEARKAEFTRLFDLFERLTNRAARKGHGVHMPPSGGKPSAEPVHHDIYDPSSVASAKEIQQPDAKPESIPTTWPHGVAQDATSLKASMTNFPAGGKWYPFTFKMMFHKLYGLEEWAKKVKDVLERSRKDFKPLSEMDWKKQTVIDENRLRPGRGASATKELAISCTCNSLASGDNIPSRRLRSRSICTLTTPRPTPSKVDEGDKASSKVTEGARIVKKRCVGRDKIFTTNPTGPEEKAWVYNAAAALMETGGAGDGALYAKKGSLVTFQVSKTDTTDNRQDLLTVTTIACDQRQRKRAFSETDTKALRASSRKRPYLLE